MPAIAIRQDIEASALRRLARLEDDGRVASRLLAIAAVLEGQSREQAARLAGMDRQTLRDWVHRFNAEGVAGLRDRPRVGRPRLLADELRPELAEFIAEGPDLERDGVVAYRLAHIQALAKSHFGAVCPQRDTGVALVMTRVSTEAMTLMLAEISQAVPADAHAVVLLDGAGWHIASDLEVPANLTLLPLPPYSPELNATERLWQIMRATVLSHRLFTDTTHIIDACCRAWNALISQPERIRSAYGYPWAMQIKTS